MQASVGILAQGWRLQTWFVFRLRLRLVVPNGQRRQGMDANEDGQEDGCIGEALDEAGPHQPEEGGTEVENRVLGGEQRHRLPHGERGGSGQHRPANADGGTHQDA